MKINFFGKKIYITFSRKNLFLIQIIDCRDGRLKSHKNSHTILTEEFSKRIRIYHVVVENGEHMMQSFHSYISHLHHVSWFLHPPKVLCIIARVCPLSSTTKNLVLKSVFFFLRLFYSFRLASKKRIVKINICFRLNFPHFFYFNDSKQKIKYVKFPQL